MTPRLSLFDPTPEEVAAHLAATPADAERLLHPSPRWHCGSCGRFVAGATVRVIPHWEYGYGSEQDERGDCSACGPDVIVSWTAG